MDQRLYQIILIFVVLGTLALTGGLFFVISWRQDRRHELRIRERQLVMEQERLKDEEKRREEQRQEESMRQYREDSRREEDALRAAAGTGTGGFIIVDLPDDQRPFFHDLLKGFEEYAKLKGYDVSFSIDATLPNRVAFKFTLREDGIGVGPERVRRDFQEYIEKVRSGADSFDDMPVVTSIEEHELLVTVLKNRISFLQHSYQLSQNAVNFYESLLAGARSFPVLPAPSVIVQTGGNMDSRSYNSKNSSRLIQGDANTLLDSSRTIDIGRSFNERRQRVDDLSALIDKLRDASNPATEKAVLELEKAKDELSEDSPNESAVARWLTKGRDVLKLANVGQEVIEAARQVLHGFALPWS